MLDALIRIVNVREPRGKDWGRLVHYDEILPDGQRISRTVENVMVRVGDGQGINNIRLSVLLRRKAKDDLLQN